MDKNCFLISLSPHIFEAAAESVWPCPDEWLNKLFPSHFSTYCRLLLVDAKCLSACRVEGQHLIGCSDWSRQHALENISRGWQNAFHVLLSQLLQTAGKVFLSGKKYLYFDLIKSSCVFFTAQILFGVATVPVWCRGCVASSVMRSETWWYLYTCSHRAY